jgi:hypothetical protein
MSSRDSKLRLERLRQVLRYEPETGNFYWIHRDTIKKKLGTNASIVRSHGYLNICIDSQYYYTHRLAWFYVHGEWPKVIDHIDGDKTNNKIENLRSVSQKCNLQNVVKPRKHNQSGIIGARKTKYGFQTSIRIDGKNYYLGHYKTAEEAHNVYLKAKRQLHEGCTI